MAPLPERMRHDEARRWSRALAEKIVATDGARYTISASLAQRPGRLFIDCLRNGRGGRRRLVAACPLGLADRAAGDLEAGGAGDRSGGLHHNVAQPREMMCQTSSG
jgi:hypothetical protein